MDSACRTLGQQFEAEVSGNDEFGALFCLRGDSAGETLEEPLARVDEDRGPMGPWSEWGAGRHRAGCSSAGRRAASRRRAAPPATLPPPRLLKKHGIHSS